MAERDMAHKDFESWCTCDCFAVRHCLYKASEEVEQSVGFRTMWFTGATTMGIWSGNVGFEVSFSKDDHRACNFDLSNWKCQWWRRTCTWRWGCFWSTKSCRYHWWNYVGWTCKGCPTSWDYSSGGAGSWRDCRGCRRQSTTWSWNAKS